jgi:hypothetical protein
VAEPKIVITGTGRAGTTLLVQILDELGLDTGLAEGKLSVYGPTARAGFESRLDDPDAPTVVKDMTLGFRFREVLDHCDVAIGHVLLPDRRLDIAAASRIRAAGYGSRPFRRGALTGTLLATEQEAVLAGMREEIVTVLEERRIPHTILEFPRFATDAVYTHERLRRVVPDASLADVERALRECVRPDMIHERPLSWVERCRVRAITTWMVVYRYPVARLRARINPERQRAKMQASVADWNRREQHLAEAERLEGRSPKTRHDRGGGAT